MQKKLINMTLKSFCGKFYHINCMSTNFAHMKICLPAMPLMLLQSR